ncbi:MAG TPA: reverse transcriptase family protein [Gammaproteobacteria bacterium]
MLEVVKIDIKKFYPSTTSLHIYKYFHEEMLCSSDVAGLITKLLTYDNHIPTGSCVSQQIAFLVHKGMFDEMQALSIHHGITMTCYVDDITFSASDIPAAFLNDIKKIIRKTGLKHHKERRYTKIRPKLITGVIVTDTGIRVRNKLLMKIHDGFESLRAAVKSGEEVKLDSLLGRINAANEISGDFTGMKRRAKRYEELKVD